MRSIGLSRTALFMSMQPENKMLVPDRLEERAPHTRPGVLALRHHGHIIVKDLLLLSVVPFDGDTGPISVDDSTGVLSVRVPDHSGAND